MIISSGAMPMPPRHDQLGVLTTTLRAVLDAPQVKIDGVRIAQVAAEWASDPWPQMTWDTNWHYFDGTTKTLNWIALLDALNFCFWGDYGHPRWRIKHGDTWYDGYAALAIALKRAIDQDYPLWDATFLATIDETILADILRATPDDHNVRMPIPLFSERLANARELGRVLIDRYEGEFANVIVAAHYDAVELTLLIAKDFSSFYDVSTWDNHVVRLFKRAQILVADIATAFQGTKWGVLERIDDLTAFADYKVPQMLRQLDILTCSHDLAVQIKRQDLLSPGSPAEVAIRASTIWAVELLRQCLATHRIIVNAATIDTRLWYASQSCGTSSQPYHRTRTIFY
jgi:hypothetical protein